MAWTKEQKQILIDNAGKVGVAKLSELIGKKENTVVMYATRNGISTYFHGHGRGKIIKDSTIKEIERLLELGTHTNRHIAKVTGVKEAYVSDIKTKRRRQSKPKPIGLIKVSSSDISILNQVFC